MSHGVGAYVQWGWRLRPMGVAYTSKGAKVAYKSKGTNLLIVLQQRQNCLSLAIPV